MSMITKHRPPTLDDIAGNEELVDSLGSVLDRDFEDLPHVFLLTGPSGCGKTTIGRIIANEVGGKAEYYEYNAANVRGIDSMREIERVCIFPPMSGKARVWLFDEVHQYPAATQEAMLKMLEEAPKHAFFILCTTDPQKLKNTLKTRCMRYEVEPLDRAEMIDFLEGIVEEEGADVPDEVLKRIAKESGGSPRGALQLLDKVIDLEEDDMINAIDKIEAVETQSIDLCRALIARSKWPVIAKILSNLGDDPERIRQSVLSYANSILLKKADDQAAMVIECFSEPFHDSGLPGVSLACYFAVRKSD